MKRKKIKNLEIRETYEGDNYITTCYVANINHEYINELAVIKSSLADYEDYEEIELPLTPHEALKVGKWLLEYAEKYGSKSK